MPRLSLAEKQKILRMQLEDYELSENSSEEILKSKRSVFSPYKDLGLFYVNNWFHVEAILKGKSWLKWLSEDERESLYYHQLREGHELYIHHKDEFTLLLKAQKRLIQTACWQNQDVGLNLWVEHQLAFRETTDFPITFANWQLTHSWLKQCDQYSSISAMAQKADKLKIYADNQPLCNHVAAVLQENHYFADWHTEHLPLATRWVNAAFLMFLSPLHHDQTERDLQQINNREMLDIWQIFSQYV